MQNLLKILEKGVITMAVIAVAGVCSAADNTTTVRGNAMNATRGRGTQNTASRMPSIPILPFSVTGNKTISNPPTPNEPAPDPDPEPEPGPTPPPPPGPTPPHPDDPDTPTPPEPEPECPDGGVKDSSYTVENCMNDVLSCVNGGALPNGINSLFNEDLRNSIVNGMGLCLTQVERCITTVRRDCQYVYASASDVWLDFNARKVQPEYYAFVLRQTGLTPTQAENTCLLLDRNTYGAAFNAVSTGDSVTSEYDQRVGAYNRQLNNSLSKANPLGERVNNTGIDGQRGYYARWDAEKAQCLLRVAAYNKDTLITNSWLFGAIGDDSPAEVWQATGSTFTCNKDLFDFSLMPTTKTVAATAIPGGTLLGAGIGALAGHGDRKFDCTNKSMRDKLLEKLQNPENNKIGALVQYMKSSKQDSQIAALTSTSKNMTVGQCKEIIDLYDFYNQGLTALQQCKNLKVVIQQVKTHIKITHNGELDGATIQQIQDALDSSNCEDAKCNNTTPQELLQCFFADINYARKDGTGVFCTGTGDRCLPPENFEEDLNTLGKIFNDIDPLEGDKSNRLKTTLIGAGTGAALGGTATAITAFVERGNINCRVADGLAQVGFGKSYTIDRLRDIYVKWALKLPNTIAPTAVVTNCDNWSLTCALFTDAKECSAAQFNFRPGNLSSTTLIQNPCVPSGSACIANLSVAQANGVCTVNPDTPDVTVPSVSSCDEWNNECKKIQGQRDCDSAKVIYTPASMQVANACRYNRNTRSCKYNPVKAQKYLDTATCSEIVPVNPDQPADR